MAEGSHWHLLPWINSPMACFAWAKDAVAACFDGGMNIPMQRCQTRSICNIGTEFVEYILEVDEEQSKYWC